MATLIDSVSTFTRGSDAEQAASAHNAAHSAVHHAVRCSNGQQWASAPARRRPADRNALITWLPPLTVRYDAGG
ncbi:hypothetical protein GCM10027093_40110 [Paraburkholderia jirisanensis]